MADGIIGRSFGWTLEGLGYMAISGLLLESIDYAVFDFTVERVGYAGPELECMMVLASGGRIRACKEFRHIP